MPIRSLNSSVFKWPGREEVLAAARLWAAEVARTDPGLTRIFCVGSYARGDWGVGSDLDVIVVTETAEGMSLVDRRRRYEAVDMPVPVDIWVCTPVEWAAMGEDRPMLRDRLDTEALDLLPT